VKIRNVAGRGGCGIETKLWMDTGWGWELDNLWLPCDSLASFCCEHCRYWVDEAISIVGCIR